MSLTVPLVAGLTFTAQPLAKVAMFPVANCRGTDVRMRRMIREKTLIGERLEQHASPKAGSFMDMATSIAKII